MTFFPEHSKLGFWLDPLIQTWKSMSLKSTQELSVMTMKNYAKFEEELICHFKVDMRNLTNFDPSTWKSLKFSFVWTKKVQRSSQDWRVIQNLQRNHQLQNWHKEFDKFWHDQSKVSKIFTLMRSFWAGYKLFNLKKYRGAIFHETEEGYKIWRWIFKIGTRNLTNFDLSNHKSQGF